MSIDLDAIAAARSSQSSSQSPAAAPPPPPAPRAAAAAARRRAAAAGPSSAPLCGAAAFGGFDVLRPVHRVERPGEPQPRLRLEGQGSGAAPGAPAAAPSSAPAMPLYVPIGVRAEKSAAEMPKRLTLTLRLPSAAAVALNAVGGVDVGGVGVDGLRDVRCAAESFGALRRALPPTTELKVAGGSPYVERALKYAPPLTRAAAEAALAAALPPPLIDSLMGFQREGVVYALRHGGRCLIADEMGLGKTLQAICVALCYRGAWPALVICPSSLVESWRRELLHWAGKEFMPPRDALGAADVHVVRGGKDTPPPSSLFTIVSYNLALKLADSLQRRGYGVLIADESHKLKNGDAQQTKAILPMIAAARHAVLLSGTPTTSRPIELWTQAHALQPKVFAKKKDFSIRFCNGHQGRFGWDEKGAAHVDELHALLAHTMMVRREKSEVLTQLPPKRRQRVDVTLPNEAALSRKLQATEAARRADGAPQHSPEFNELYLDTGRAKVEPVMEVVTELLDSGAEKLLLFGHHKEVLSALEARLVKKKVGLVRIDGDTAVDARLARVDIFQKQAGTRVALLSICAASHGLTLTAASLVVFAELSWNASDLVQAEDRVHRISQTNAVLIKYCLGGPVDKIIWETVRRKLNVTSAAISGESRTLDAEEAEAPAAAPLSLGPPPPSVASFFGPAAAAPPRVYGGAPGPSLSAPSPPGALAATLGRPSGGPSLLRGKSPAAKSGGGGAPAANKRDIRSMLGAGGGCAAQSALPRPKEKAAAAAPLAHAADANKPAHSNAAGKRKWVAPPDDDEEMERDFPL